MLPRCEVLGNGLRVVLAPCEAESAALGVFVETGSRHENRKNAGISHLIEHMLFKGTPTRKPIDIIKAIEGRGGNFNACTSAEMTCYYAHLPSEHLEEAIDIFSDMYLNATIPENEFEREKRVVIEEIKMYADDPNQVVEENLQRNLFPKSSLGAPIAGTAASLMPMTAEDLRRHIDTHYLAKNTAVIVVGAFDEAKTLASINRKFAGVGKRKARVPKMVAVDLAIAPKHEQTVSREVQQTQIAIGFRTFGFEDSDRYAASVMDSILGRGMSSRLFQEVRERRGLSYDISSRVQLFSGTGAFVVATGLDGAKEKQMLATIEREFRRIRETKVSAEELRRTKEFMIGNFRLSHERAISKLFFYGQTLLTFNRLMLPSEQVEQIAAVTREDVMRVARRIFNARNKSISRVVPK